MHTTSTMLSIFLKRWKKVQKAHFSKLYFFILLSWWAWSTVRCGKYFPCYGSVHTGRFSVTLDSNWEIIQPLDGKEMYFHFKPKLNLLNIHSSLYISLDFPEGYKICQPAETYNCTWPRNSPTPEPKICHFYSSAFLWIEPCQVPPKKIHS